MVSFVVFGRECSPVYFKIHPAASISNQIINDTADIGPLLATEDMLATWRYCHPVWQIMWNASDHEIISLNFSLSFFPTFIYLFFLILCTLFLDVSDQV